MTDISGIQQVFEKVIEQAQNAPVDKASAAPGDIEKFQAALAQPPAEPPAVNPAGNAEAPAKVEGVAAAEDTSPGQRILDKLQQLSTGYNDTMNEFKALDLNGKISPAELLGMQAQLMFVTVNTDVVAKVGGTLDKQVDTLLKGQ
jgi:type III secretion system YscI/HrpB-like protein